MLGRIHEQASLEQNRDVEALYNLIDPLIRAKRERERDDEPDLTLSDIRRFVREVHAVQVEEIEIVEVQRASQRHGGRPAALVRVVLRYNGKPAAQELRTIWVRDCRTWYSTALNERLPTER